MDQEIVNQIKKLEVELLTTETRRSPDRLGELLADDFFEFMQNGEPANKKEIIEILPNSAEFDFEMRNFEIKEVAVETFLVHYVLDRVYKENKTHTTTLCSSLWQKRTDEFQMIFFQGTPAK